jgi:hypothetical protein
MRSSAELKVPLGGFRGEFLAELAGSDDDACEGAEV